MNNVISLDKYRKSSEIEEVVQYREAWEHSCGSQSWEIHTNGNVLCRFCKEHVATAVLTFIMPVDYR